MMLSAGLTAFLDDLGRLADLNSAMVQLRIWSDRWQQRRQLAELDDRMLRDIGLRREEVMREVAKPFFWR